MRRRSPLLERDMKRFALLVLCLLLACPTPLVAARGTWTAPKLINFYLNWQISDADLARLSRWDVVVLDMDVAWSAPEDIRALRAANPKIKILAYVSAGELSQSRRQGDPSSPGHRLASRASEELFMHSTTGSRLSWWSGAELMNATDEGPTAHGVRWADVLPAFVHDEMMSTGLWDGVFLDGAYSDITWFFGPSIDPDGDGVAASSDKINAAWQAGMSRLLRNMRRAVGARGLILVNSSTIYHSLVNGVLIENFPRYGWEGSQTEMLHAERVNVAPSLTAYNTNTEDRETPDDYRLMRYGLTSAMLGDGFFSFDAGPTHHARTWWYDEYDASLGRPTGAPRRLDSARKDVAPGVWIREFERGAVVVNSTTGTRRVTLPATYELLFGDQDPAANTGERIRTFDLPAEDGRVLVRSLSMKDLQEGGFINGGYLRAYRQTGTRARNGFFTLRTDLPRGADVSVVPFSSQTPSSMISAHRGELTVQTGTAQIAFRPFGAAYTGTLWVAVGNVRGDNSREIIVGRDGSPDVRIFDRVGRELDRWSVDDVAYRGGVRVAALDVDRDGRDELVLGAGPGNAPRVQIRTGDGALWHEGFLAFDTHERGGVAVAVGDADQDGHADILVGSGEGAIPRVRVFDAMGMLKQEIRLGDVPVLSGIAVQMGDIDADGIREILVRTETAL